VEQRDRLAIVVRRQISVAMIDFSVRWRADGIHHVAIELDPDGAPLPGD
jgi:hypothetical protein